MKVSFGQGFFNPGISYKIYTPTVCDTLGQFNGLSLKFNLFQSDNREELYYRSYISVEQLRNNQKNYFFCYSTGILVGVEKEVHRNFLIPFLGIEYGQMVIKGIGKSSHLTPLAGISVINNHQFEVSASCGYKYPFFQQEYAGFVSEVSLVINLHNIEL